MERSSDTAAQCLHTLCAQHHTVIHNLQYSLSEFCIIAEPTLFLDKTTVCPSTQHVGVASLATVRIAKHGQSSPGLDIDTTRHHALSTCQNKYEIKLILYRNN